MTDKFHNLFIDLKKDEQIINEALVVIDTNILLMAYQWKEMTFQKVYEVLERLVERRKLVIPNQVKIVL